MSIAITEVAPLALSIVEEARTLLLSKVEQGFAVKQKQDKSFVTDVDLAVEELIRARLTQHFPEHGVIGEEFPNTNPDSPFQWTVDPIDGTNSFRSGIPLYGMLVSLLEKEEPLLGVLELPGLKKSFHAIKGSGGYLNGKALPKLPEGPSANLKDEIILVGERIQFEVANKLQVYDKLSSNFSHLRVYCDCFGHSLVAQGSAVAMVDFDLHIWDLAPSKLLITELGGDCQVLSEHTSPEGMTKYDVILGQKKAVEELSELII